MQKISNISYKQSSGGGTNAFWYKLADDDGDDDDDEGDEDDRSIPTDISTPAHSASSMFATLV